MHQLKLIKIFLFFAALLLVAKPFLGFAFFSRTHPPAAKSIFVKAFTKRTLEYSENSSLDSQTILKKLADPLTPVLLFAFLLAMLFPLVLLAGSNTTNRFLREMLLGLSPRRPTWLLNSKLII